MSVTIAIHIFQTTVLNVGLQVSSLKNVGIGKDIQSVNSNTAVFNN